MAKYSIMVHSRSSILELILINILLLQITFTKSQDPSIPPVLVMDLIHDHSVFSPSYDPKNTINDLADIDLKSSISRASFLTANATTLYRLNSNIESFITPRRSGFFVHLEVGQKNVWQNVYMDTGSSLLWINCEPCGINVPAPLYHPMESSSFRYENCEDSEVCDYPGAVRIQCDEDECSYYLYYGGKSFSRGYLATETFKFGKYTLTKIIFGCAQLTNLYANGVLGLSANRLSLISQRHSSKFSYCIGNISDSSYRYSKLVIGDRIKLWGSTTPLIVEDKYYITLEGIKIGDASVDIDREVFKRTSDYHGGMVVDTGSTYTYIPHKQLQKLEVEIMNTLDGSLLVQNHTIMYKWYSRLCYNGLISRDLKGFPTVEFQFQGDAIMELTAENIFQQISDLTFCLGFLPSEVLRTDISLLGYLMQQSFYIAFDIAQKKLSFQRIDCSSLEDYIRDELEMNN